MAGSLAILALVACGRTATPTPEALPSATPVPSTPTATATTTPVLVPSPAPTLPPDSVSLPSLTLTPSPTSVPATPTPSPTFVPEPTPSSIEELARHQLSRYFSYVWKTDFSQRTIPLEEIRFLGLARDRIPPIYSPVFETVKEAGKWLESLEPVIAIEINGDARAYPLAILTLHEVVNDEVGGQAIAVTY